MGGLSIWHIVIIAVLVMLLFGRGKIADLMGDVAQGIKNFREGMKDEKKPEIAAQKPEKPEGQS